jgi:hypothetical protein
METSAHEPQRRRFQFSLKALLIVMLVLAAFFAGRWPHMPTHVPDLSGRWQMSLPAGFQHQITIKRVDEKQFFIGPTQFNTSGIYEVRGRELHIVKPSDERLTGFVWTITDDDNLILVDQPNVSKIGADYRGATLARAPEISPESPGGIEDELKVGN